MELFVGSAGLRGVVVLAGLDDDVGELFGIDQPPQGVDGELKLLPFGNRLLADLSGGHLHVLLGDGGDDVRAVMFSAASLSGSSQARRL